MEKRLLIKSFPFILLLLLSLIGNDCVGWPGTRDPDGNPIPNKGLYIGSFYQNSIKFIGSCEGKALTDKEKAELLPEFDIVVNSQTGNLLKAAIIDKSRSSNSGIETEIDWNASFVYSGELRFVDSTVPMKIDGYFTLSEIFFKLNLSYDQILPGCILFSEGEAVLEENQ